MRKNETFYLSEPKNNIPIPRTILIATKNIPNIFISIVFFHFIFYIILPFCNMVLYDKKNIYIWRCWDISRWKS